MRFLALLSTFFASLLAYEKKASAEWCMYICVSVGKCEHFEIPISSAHLLVVKYVHLCALTSKLYFFARTHLIKFQKFFTPIEWPWCCWYFIIGWKKTLFIFSFFISGQLQQLGHPPTIFIYFYTNEYFIYKHICI